jgi:hypothetical protein
MNARVYENVRADSCEVKPRVNLHSSVTEDKLMSSLEVEGFL